MIHTKREGGDPNRQRNMLGLNFSYLAIKYEFYFITQYKNNSNYQKVGVKILVVAQLLIHDYLGQVMFSLRV